MVKIKMPNGVRRMEKRHGHQIEVKMGEASNRKQSRSEPTSVKMGLVKRLSVDMVTQREY